MVFKAIPSKTSAADDCLAAIERAIVRGELAPGDRLPPERTLATMLDRNRLTVRNALGRLADAGLLSVRQGEWIYCSGHEAHRRNLTDAPRIGNGFRR